MNLRNLSPQTMFERLAFEHKPLLIDIGIYDTCFLIEGAMACFRRLEKIYLSAGARQNLELDLFPGEHAWGGNKSVEFFHRHLGG